MKKREYGDKWLISDIISYIEDVYHLEEINYPRDSLTRRLQTYIRSKYGDKAERAPKTNAYLLSHATAMDIAYSIFVTDYLSKQPQINPPHQDFIHHTRELYIMTSQRLSELDAYPFDKAPTEDDLINLQDIPSYFDERYDEVEQQAFVDRYRRICDLFYEKYGRLPTEDDDLDPADIPYVPLETHRPPISEEDKELLRKDFDYEPVYGDPEFNEPYIIGIRKRTHHQSITMAENRKREMKSNLTMDALYYWFFSPVMVDKLEQDYYRVLDHWKEHHDIEYERAKERLRNPYNYVEIKKDHLGLNNVLSKYKLTDEQLGQICAALASSFIDEKTDPRESPLYRFISDIVNAAISDAFEKQAAELNKIREQIKKDLHYELALLSIDRNSDTQNTSDVD